VGREHGQRGGSGRSGQRERAGTEEAVRLLGHGRVPSSVRVLQADGLLDEAEDLGVVDHAREALGAQAARADEDIGAAMRLAAGRHRDHGFLVVGLVVDDRVGERGARGGAVLAGAEAQDGVRVAAHVGGGGAVHVALEQAEHAGVAVAAGAGALGIAVEHQRVVVVRGDDDERVLQARVDRVELVQRAADGGIEGHRVLQRLARRGLMQRMVDAAAFHHQEEALLPGGQHIDGLGGHLGQARLLGHIAVQVVGHVAAGEQARHLAVAGRQRIELGLVAGVPVAGRLQFGDQVAAVGARAARGRRLEVPAAAAEDHVHAIAQRGVVARAGRHQLRGDGVLAIAVADVRIGGRRRGMRDARGRDHARAVACGLHQLQQCRHRLAVAAGRAGAVGAGHVILAARIERRRVGRHGDDLVVHLHAGHVRRHRRRGIGHLRVVGEGPHEAGLGQRVHGQLAVFAHLVDARGGHGGQAHAVAEKEHHVLGLARDGGTGVRHGNAGGSAVAAARRQGERGQRGGGQKGKSMHRWLPLRWAAL